MTEAVTEAAAPDPPTGFTPKRRVYVLDFEGTDLDGLEVRTRSAPIGMMLALGELLDQAGAVPDQAALAGLAQAEQMRKMAGFMKQIRAAVDRFATVLLGWNLTDEQGGKVPATVEGLLTLDPGELMLLIRTWTSVIAEAPAPLPQPSSSGGPSLEGSLPMEPLSESLAV